MKKKIFIILSIIFYLFFELFLTHIYMEISIFLNGKEVRGRRGETVKIFLKRLGIEPKAGDLIDVEGKVLQEGKGKPFLIWINGKRVFLSEEIKEGDRIFTRKGENVRENLVEQIESVSPPIIFTGRGAFLSVEKSGQAGVKIVKRGEISRKIFKEELLREPLPTIIRRSSESPLPLIALTFDDGPDPRYTPAILNILKKFKAAATFFVIGREAQRHPQIIKAIKSSGCLLGNHSYSHLSLGKARFSVVREELLKTSDILFKITGDNPHWLRPPGGSVNLILLKFANSLGYRIVLWDIDPWDWSKPDVNTIYRRVVTKAKPGSVILLHDGGGNRKNTLLALPLILKSLTNRGFSFVTLDDLYFQKH